MRGKRTIYQLLQYFFRKSLLILLATFFLSSCASIFNSKSTELTVFTSEKTSLKLDSDSANLDKPKNSQHKVKVKRSREGLTVTADSETESKTVLIKSKNSVAFNLNFVPYLPFAVNIIPGVLVDRNNPKRYTYPKKVYIEMGNDSISYLTYKPLEKAYRGLKNVLKINALKMASFEIGGVEMSFERKTSNKFSTQLSAAYLLPFIWNFEDFKPKKIRGFQFGIEKRLYWKKTAPIGYYVAGELNYLNNQYRFTDSFEAQNQYYYIEYQDEFVVKKQTFSLNIKIGQQFFIKRMSIDLSAGLGLRSKSVRYLDQINPDGEVDVDYFIFPSIKDLNNKPGNYLALSLPISLRIGYLF